MSTRSGSVSSQLISKTANSAASAIQDFRRGGGDDPPGGLLLKGQVANAVNMASVDPKELAEVRPFVDLARRLGLLHAQIAHGAIRKATLTYKGDLAGRKTRLLTAAFTAGLLEYRLSEGVNLVNAAHRR